MHTILKVIVPAGDPDPLAPTGYLVADLESTPASTITNCSGLIHALTEAAELEHGLMVQYLLAAVSMRKGPLRG